MKNSKHTGYTYGNDFAIDNDTGEILKTSSMQIIEGSRVYSPQDIAAWQEAKKRREEREMIEKANQGKPRFMFIKNTAPFDQLPPATVVRLIVVGTYASYDGRLLFNCRTPMRRAHLQEILDMSAGNVSSFLKDVMPQYIFEGNGVLRVSDDPVFKRGQIKRSQHDSWTRFYIEATRNLYHSALHGSRKHLGYIFQMLPYINVENNIMCKNPLAKHIEDVEPITLGEYADMIGYDRKNIDRLLRAYKKLRFAVNGKVESFCWFVNDGLNIADSKIIINPLVLYSGKNPDGVRNLSVLCSSVQKSIHKN